MSKKKIVHIVEAFGGGVFTYFVELANSMCDEFDIVIAYAKRKQTPENFKDYFSKNIKLIEIKNFTRSIDPIKDIKAGIEIYNIVKQEKPDIVHMHSSKAGIIGRFVVSSKNQKLFYTPHGYAFLKQDDSKLKRLMYKDLEKIAARIKPSCKIVACSKGEYEESLKIIKNCTYINNGINTEETDSIINKDNSKEIDFNNLKICTIGRIGFQKNPSVFNDIAKKFPNIQFTWIGDGELRDVLNSQNIKITGWKSRQEVLQELSKNDIFLLPSLWEGLPIALLEAMYLKKIYIVSNVIGNKDVIENERNGFVCNELDDYVNVIDKIEKNDYNINDILSKSVYDINDIYNTRVMSKAYNDLYIK